MQAGRASSGLRLDVVCVKPPYPLPDPFAAWLGRPGRGVVEKQIIYVWRDRTGANQRDSGELTVSGWTVGRVQRKPVNEAIGQR